MVVKLVRIVLLKFKIIDLLIIDGRLILTSSSELNVLNLSNKTIVSLILYPAISKIAAIMVRLNSILNILMKPIDMNTS